MFQHYLALLEEILTEVGLEASTAPIRLLLEFIQFVALVAIVWVVAVGFGKRKGFITNMLAERAASTAARLDEASRAPEELASAKRESGARTRSSRAEARAIIARAKKEAAELESTSGEETAAEAARIGERAQAALETEQQEMLLEMREQLVDVVASATRAILNEKMSVAEQRKLIEASILETIKAAEKPAAVEAGVS